MPPRSRYSADDILQGALALVRAEGVGALSARSLAASLGCSTGPLFTCFANMEELEARLMDRVVAAFVEAAAAPADPDPLVAAGLGWLGFAAREPRLYEALFLGSPGGAVHEAASRWGPIRRLLARRMGDHPRYAHLSEAARFALVGRASVVLHGLGLELWSGRLPSQDPAGRRLYVEQLVLPVVEVAMAQGWHIDLHSGPAARRRGATPSDSIAPVSPARTS